MPSRPDLRELAANVKEAFAEMDRETLLDILTFVVKEYVVEGPPPMLVHQAETLADLQGLSFAQLVQALQTRLDHPELAMFAVDGNQVSVRVGGVMQPLLAARQPLTGSAEAAAPPPPGVRVVETTLQQRPPQPAPAPQQGSAPPPARGLSVRGRPQGEAEAPAAPQGAQPPQGGQPSQGAQPRGAQPSQAASPQAAQPPQGGQSAPADKDKPEGGDDASERFSLLELD